MFAPGYYGNTEHHFFYKIRGINLSWSHDRVWRASCNGNITACVSHLISKWIILILTFELAYIVLLRAVYINLKLGALPWMFGTLIKTFRTLSLPLFSTIAVYMQWLSGQVFKRKNCHYFILVSILIYFNDISNINIFSRKRNI